ncbi:Uncharacterised protein [Mycobacteroides abscessus subsp. abscessus]|nr:Uncharacterised protein [Mycobacteroides abscessus subsp. abscessus]
MISPEANSRPGSSPANRSLTSPGRVRVKATAGCGTLAVSGRS